MPPNPGDRFFAEYRDLALPAPEINLTFATDIICRGSLAIGEVPFALSPLPKQPLVPTDVLRL